MKKKLKNWERYNSISVLSSVIEGRIYEYEYKLARYLNKPEFRLRNFSEYNYFYQSGFAYRQDGDLAQPPQVNVVKSVVDSLVSKLANNKTRPYFTPINGLYKTRKVVEQIQSFFDVFFDEAKIHKHVANAFRNACIFDIGYLFCDPFTKEIYNVPTWAISLLHTEMVHGDPTKMLIRHLNYPTTLLQKYDIDFDSALQYVEFSIFVDSLAKEAVLYVDQKERKRVELTYDILPVVPVYFNEPVFGGKTVSVVDELDGIQTQIDLINSKISAASQLTAANQVFVYEGGGSSLKAGDLNNKEGNVFAIDMPVGTSSLPVVNVTPAVFDGQWMSMLQYYVGQAYEIIGISQLSAMSKKPAGIDSGVALETLEDVESDRFKIQLDHYVNAYIDLAKMMIQVLPEDAQVLPEASNSSSITWKDVKTQQDLFKILYSAMSSFSKNPSEKRKEIMQMSQIGLVPPSKVAQYLDMPDLQDAYKGASAVQHGIDTVIERAIELEDYTVPDFVDVVQLAQELSTLQNELYSCLGADKKANRETIVSLERLANLEDALMVIVEEQGAIAEEQGEAVVTEQGFAAGAQQGAVQGTDVTDLVAQQNQFSEVGSDDQVS